MCLYRIAVYFMLYGFLGLSLLPPSVIFSRRPVVEQVEKALQPIADSVYRHPFMPPGPTPLSRKMTLNCIEVLIRPLFFFSKVLDATARIGSFRGSFYLARILLAPRSHWCFVFSIVWQMRFGKFSRSDTVSPHARKEKTRSALRTCLKHTHDLMILAPEDDVLAKVV